LSKLLFNVFENSAHSISCMW